MNTNLEIFAKLTVQLNQGCFTRKKKNFSHLFTMQIIFRLFSILEKKKVRTSDSEGGLNKKKNNITLKFGV